MVLLGLYCLGRVARRAIVIFAALQGVWGLLAVLEIARREPILGSWAVLEIAPILWAYAAVPCALAALAAGVAGTIAELGHEGELIAAAASGIGPRTWLTPIALLALAVTPWTWHGMAEVMPLTRAARNAEKRLLLRSPEVCLRLLGADPGLLERLWLHLRPRERGEFDDLWMVELGTSELPQQVWRARRGSVSAPAATDALRLELEDVTLWRRNARGELVTATAEALTMERPVPELARAASPQLDFKLGEQSLGELAAQIARSPPGPERDLARAELAARWALALAPLPLLIAACALGLALARRGAWAGVLGGIALVGAFLLPAQASCTRWIAAGAPSWVAALPALALLAVSAVPLRRWRPR